MADQPIQSRETPAYALAKARLLTAWWGGEVVSWVHDADRLTEARLDMAEAERALRLSRPLGAGRLAK